MAKSQNALKKLTSYALTLKKYQPKSYTPVLVILLIIAAFLVGVLFTKVQYLEKGTATVETSVTNTTDTNAPAAPSVSIDAIKELFKKGNIYFGDANKKNLFVEVADPSCPYCHIAAGLNPELSKQVGPNFTYKSDGGNYVPPVIEMKKLVDSGEAGFVWIYTNGHGNGEMGTKALYCAYESGKFWEVHDLLMTNQGYDLLNNTVKNDKAKSGEIANFLSSVFPYNDMKSCLDSGKYDDKLSEDTSAAQGLGITGTPGFYVNTTLFGGAYSWTDMEKSLK